MGVSWKLSLFSLIGVGEFGGRFYDEKEEINIASSIKRSVSSGLRQTQGIVQLIQDCMFQTMPLEQSVSNNPSRSVCVPNAEKLSILVH